jgi:toxin ParE1/3/4
MAWRIGWADSALERVTVFLDFIAEENPPAARRVIQKLFDRVDTLADFPHLGRPLLSGIDPTLRRIVFGSYVVVYQAVESAQTISIVAIRHSRERSLPQEEPPE